MDLVRTTRLPGASSSQSDATCETEDATDEFKFKLEGRSLEYLSLGSQIISMFRIGTSYNAVARNFVDA